MTKAAVCHQDKIADEAFKAVDMALRAAYDVGQAGKYAGSKEGKGIVRAVKLAA